jgi:hypothetical protein
MTHLYPRFRAALAFLLTIFLAASLCFPPVTARAADRTAAPSVFFAIPNPRIFPSPTCTQGDPCGLQRAVQFSASGDIVYAAGGKYTSTATQVLNIDDSVRVQGGWSGAGAGRVVINPIAYPTILDGQSARRVIHISGSVSPILRGLTIENGKSAGTGTWDGYGGGISTDFGTYGDLTIEYCVIRNNYAEYYGGGIQNFGGTLTVRKSELYNNSTLNNGGAINTDTDSFLTIENSSAYNNSAAQGVLINAFQANITARGNFFVDHVDDSPLIFNESWSVGNFGLVILENNIIGNIHGPVFSGNGDAIIVTMNHNTMDAPTPHAIHLTNGASGSITNNIFVGQTAESIFVESSPLPTIRRNLFWQNGSSANLGTESIQANPLLSADYHLGSGSPAVDAAFATALTHDYDGDARPLGPASDIGADERLYNYTYLPGITR